MKCKQALKLYYNYIEAYDLFKNIDTSKRWKGLKIISAQLAEDKYKGRNTLLLEDDVPAGVYSIFQYENNKCIFFLISLQIINFLIYI